MHIGVGEFEGKELKDPVGSSVSSRTLTIKEEIFTIIGTRVIEASVLDINDPNGLYGIESLSRGATICRFVNEEKTESALVSENLKIVGLPPEDMVITDKIESFIKNPVVGEVASEKYDVIFYEMKEKGDLDLLDSVLKKQKPSGVTAIIYPHQPNFEIPEMICDAKIVESREFENKKIALYLKVNI